MNTQGFFEKDYTTTQEVIEIATDIATDIASNIFNTNSVLAGQVVDFASLPAANTQTGKEWLVEQSTGTWLLFNYKQAGIYRSDGTNWILLDSTPSIIDTFINNTVSLSGAYANPTWITSLDANKIFSLTTTGIVKSTNGTISYLTDNSSNWNTSYNRSPTGLAVSGTTTKTLTLTKQDGTTLTANWSDLNNDAVPSVFGRTGAVVATEGDYSLNLLSDVAITTPATNQLLQYNGTTWLNWSPSYLTLTSLSATSPLTYNNTTGAFNIAQSNTTTNGFLSSADWNTFNNKQSALTNPVTGTGTTNILPKFSASSTLVDSAITDNGTSVAIGTNALQLFKGTPTGASASTSMGYTFSSSASLNGVPSGLVLENATGAGILSLAINVGQVGTRNTTWVGGIFRLDTRSAEQRFTILGQPTGGSVETERFSVNLQDGTTYLNLASGNTGIGYAKGTTLNYKLDVNGTSRFVNGLATATVYEGNSAFTALNTTATLTIAQLLTLVIESTPTANITFTLPTGTLMEGGVMSSLDVNKSFVWSVVNIATGFTITMAGGTAHTYVGNTTIAANTSATFRSQKTATNTFRTVRL